MTSLRIPVAVVVSLWICPVSQAEDVWLHLVGMTNEEYIVATDDAYVWIPVEVNQHGWTNTFVGYGTGSNPDTYTWTQAYYYQDGQNLDRKVAAPVLFSSPGVYNIVARSRQTDAQSWFYVATTNWISSSTFTPSLTVTVADPASSVDPSFIVSGENNMVLYWESPDDESSYTVEWKHEMTDPWNDTWTPLQNISGESGVMSVGLPKFFRVRKYVAPETLEVIYVPSTGAPVPMTTAFAKGHYTYVHDGVYRYDFVGSSQKFTDGVYLQGDDLQWSLAGPSLTLHVNGAYLIPARPDVFRHHHEYDFVIIGNEPLSFTFSIYDPLNYTDNDGGLYVSMLTR